MKADKSLLICILLAIYGLSYGQSEQFNLSDYKLPDLNRRALVANLNSVGSNNYAENPGSPYSTASKGGSSQFRTDAALYYNHSQNNAVFQKELNCGINFRSNYWNMKDGDVVVNSSNELSPALFLRNDIRKYYSGHKFIEYGINLDYQYNRSSDFSKGTTSTPDYNAISHINKLSLQVPFRFGTGRIERVQDARHALYIFDELANVQRLSAGKTNKEIVEFAELISKLKDKRFFDSRLRRISELESVDSFLVARNHLLKSDAKYFATLGDFWDYGNSPIRYSGTRISGAIIPAYYLETYNTNPYPYNSDVYKSNIAALNVGFELKHEKPMNLYWQNTIDLNAYAGYMAGHNGSNLRIPNYQIGFNQSIGYYPNTRTDMSLGYSLDYMQILRNGDYNSSIRSIQGKGLQTGVNIKINYYISPKLSLKLTSSLTYTWQDSKDNLNLNYNNLNDNSFIVSNFYQNSVSGYDSNFRSKNFLSTFQIGIVYNVF